MGEKQIYITQSLIKSLLKYIEKEECGLIFEKKFLENRFDLFPPSDAMALGTWFEYCATKALPKNGVIPQPERTSKGELTAAYKKAEAQLDNFKKFMTFYGIKILEAGVDVVFDGLKGTYDIICLATRDIIDEHGTVRVKANQKFIIDTKFSGMLDDRWSEFGWNLETLNKKVNLIMQPIHYMYLSELAFGERYPFVFLLFSSTNEKDFRAIFFDVSDEDIERHKELIYKTGVKLKKIMEKGFKARPDVLRCAECPIKVGCKHFEAVPKLQYFLLTNPNA